MSAKTAAVLAFAWLFCCGREADAQSETAGLPPRGDGPASYWDRTLPAPRNALEVTLATSLVAGLGQVADPASHHVSDTIDSGTSFQLGVGYRLSPAWLYGITTAYEPYEKGPSDSAEKAQGAVARAGVTYHFNPSLRTDSWVSGGAGYRWLHESSANANMHDFHGFELASLTTGFDIRIAPRVAFGPALGADVNTLLWDGAHFSADQRLSVFWYLGVQMRMDLGGDTIDVGNPAVR